LIHFKNITTNYGKGISERSRKNVVIMGRKTWESLPDKSKPLKERINIILTSKSDYLKTIQKNYGEVYVCNSLENALQFIDTDLFDSVANTFIIGGSLLYEEALNHDNSREVFLTRVGIDYSCDKVISKDSLKNYIHLETSRSCSENLVPFDFQRFISKKYHNESNGSPIFRD
jgi:dihydrofolate reductase